MKAAKAAIDAYKEAGAKDDEVAALTGYTEKYVAAVNKVEQNVVTAATGAVETYEADDNDLTDASKIATAVGKISTDGAAAVAAVAKVTNAQTKAALTQRITTVDNNIKAAATVSTIAFDDSGSDVAVSKTGSGTSNGSKTINATLTNAAGVDITALSVAGYTPVFTWTVDSVKTDAEGSHEASTTDLTLTNADTKAVTVQIKAALDPDPDVNDKYNVKLVVTQSSVTGDGVSKMAVVAAVEEAN